jgi:hypothetical protein
MIDLSLKIDADNEKELLNGVNGGQACKHAYRFTRDAFEVLQFIIRGLKT